MSPGGESKGIALFQQWESSSRAASSSCCSPWAALASFPGLRVENEAFLTNCSSSGLSHTSLVVGWGAECRLAAQRDGAGRNCIHLPPRERYPWWDSSRKPSRGCNQEISPYAPSCPPEHWKITYTMSWVSPKFVSNRDMHLSKMQTDKKGNASGCSWKIFWKFSLTHQCF